MRVRRGNLKIGSRPPYGATLVEVSITAVVFFLLLFGFMDVCRVLIIRSLMLAGTQDGLRLARVLGDLSMDTRDLSPEINNGVPNADQILLNRFLYARNLVVEETVRLPGQFLALPGGTGDAVLEECSQGYQTQLGTYSSASAAAILRPSESASFFGGTVTTSYPTSDENGNLITVSTMPEALRYYPMIIELRARVSSLLPIPNFDYNLRVRGIGYKEVGIRPTDLSDPPLPETNPVPLAPTNTPGGPETPTATPRPTCAPFSCPAGQYPNLIECNCGAFGGY